MYEKISQSDFPHIRRAIGAANYVRKIYDHAILFNKYLLPDLYCECIAAGWERYSAGGDGDEVFKEAVRAGRRYIWNELKIQRYDYASLMRSDERKMRFSVKGIARVIHKSHGALTLRQCVRKAYIVREKLSGNSFASIARELNCDDANVLYHFNSVVAILTAQTARLRDKEWQRRGKKGRRKRFAGEPGMPLRR